MKSARQLVDEALAVVETLSIEQAQALHGRTDEALRGLTEHYTRTAQVVAQQAPAPRHAP